MTAEGLILHKFALQRHDSMYVFLLPCMYWLFGMILHFQGKRFKRIRTLSLCIYIIHPMMIIAVRLIAKVFRLQNLLIENSLLHFSAVCLLSAVFGIAATALLNKCLSKNIRPDTDTDRAWIEVNLKNLVHNAQILKNASRPVAGLWL